MALLEWILSISLMLGIGVAMNSKYFKVIEYGLAGVASIGYLLYFRLGFPLSFTVVEILLVSALAGLVLGLLKDLKWDLPSAVENLPRAMQKQYAWKLLPVFGGVLFFHELGHLLWALYTHSFVGFEIRAGIFLEVHATNTQTITEVTIGLLAGIFSGALFLILVRSWIPPNFWKGIWLVYGFTCMYDLFSLIKVLRLGFQVGFGTPLKDAPRPLRM